MGGKLRQGTSFNEVRPGTPINIDQVLPATIKVGFRQGIGADARKAVAQVQLDNRLHVAANIVFES